MKGKVVCYFLHIVYQFVLQGNVSAVLSVCLQMYGNHGEDNGLSFCFERFDL